MPNSNLFKALFWLFEAPFWDSSQNITMKCWAELQYFQISFLAFWRALLRFSQSAALTLEIEPGKICQKKSIVHNKSCLQKNSSTNAIHIMSVLQNTFSVSQNIFGLVNKLCEIGLPMEVNYIVFVFVFVKKNQHCICICIWSTICEIWLPMEVNRYKSIYPFQRHDLPPTLDIITHNFPKFPNFSTRKLCEIGLPIEVNRYQKKQSSPQIYVTFGTLKHPKWSFFINVYWLKYNTSRTIS